MYFNHFYCLIYIHTYVRMAIVSRKHLYAYVPSTTMFNPYSHKLLRKCNVFLKYFAAIVLIFNHSWSKMHVFDVLTTLQLLVLNIYTRNFGLRMDKSCQIFFYQICFCSKFPKYSHRQSFRPYSRCLDNLCTISSVCASHQAIAGPFKSLPGRT